MLAPFFACCVNIQGGQHVSVDSITAAQFKKVPTVKKDDQITSLEEEKVMAYYAGGKLYATTERQEPWL